MEQWRQELLNALTKCMRVYFTWNAQSAALFCGKKLAMNVIRKGTWRFAGASNGWSVQGRLSAVFWDAPLELRREVGVVCPAFSTLQGYETDGKGETVTWEAKLDAFSPVCESI